MSTEPLFWNDTTIRLAETAVLNFDSETLIAALKDRVAVLVKQPLN